MAITSSQASAVIEDFLNRCERNVLEPPDAATARVHVALVQASVRVSAPAPPTIIYFTTSALARATHLPVDIVRRTIPIMRDDAAPIIATGVPAAPEPHHSGKRPEVLAWVKPGATARTKVSRRMKRRRRGPVRAATAPAASDIA